MPLATTSTSNSSARGSQSSSCSMVNGPERSCTTAAVIFMAMRELFGCVRGLSHTFDRFGEIFGCLCAGDCKLAAEDKAGHAVDPRLFGGQRVTLYFCNIFIACQRLADGVRIEADIRGSLHQHGVTGKVGTRGEIQIHQLLFHLGCLADFV